MNPLEKRVQALEAELKALKESRTFPIEVQNAFAQRLNALLAASSTTGSYSSIRRTINLSGDPESISVLEDPAGYILVRFKGSTYKVPYFVD